MTCGNLILQISRQYCYSVWGKSCFIWNVYFQFYYWKNNVVFCSLTKIDLFLLSIFIWFVLFCIPGTCVFYNSWKIYFYLHLWSNNQLSCGILRKIFTMRAGDYERIINMIGLKYIHNVFNLFCFTRGLSSNFASNIKQISLNK